MLATMDDLSIRLARRERELDALEARAATPPPAAPPPPAKTVSTAERAAELRKMGIL